MCDILKTERDIIDFLISNSKPEFASPTVIVTSRIQEKQSMIRLVRFELMCNINNEALVNKLSTLCFEHENIRFVGSETNLQVNVEVDYLIFEATIPSSSNTL